MSANPPLSPVDTGLKILRVDPVAALIILDIDGMTPSQVLARGGQLAAALNGREQVLELGADRYQWALSGNRWQAWLLFEELSEALWIELAHPDMFLAFVDQFRTWIHPEGGD